MEKSGGIEVKGHKVGIVKVLRYLYFEKDKRADTD